MATLPHYLQAKQATVLSIIPQNVSAGGVLSDGTPVDVLASGIFDTITYSYGYGLFEVSPSNAGIENYQDAKATFTVTLSTLDKDAKNNPVITQYLTGSKYIRIPLQCGNGQTLNVIAIMDTMQTGLTEQRNTTVITARPCGQVPTLV